MNNNIYSIEDIQRIVTPIAKQHGLSRVYIFGSYSKGLATENSDIDLCLDASNLDGLFSLSAVYTDLQNALQKPLDIVTIQSLQYNNNSDFIDNLKKERVLIYECN